MATVIAPPRILSTQRLGKDIYVRYEAGASGYTVMIYEVRTETSGWRQSTQETTRQGHYTLHSWGNPSVPLDVDTAYYVRMRARHSSGVLTGYSNEVKVDPITVAPPRILSAARTANAWITVQYEAGASGYTAMYYQLRTTSRGWSQATSESTLNGQYTITSWDRQPLDPLQTYWVRATAGHESGRQVAYSNEVQVGPWQVAAPSIVSVSRVGEKQVRINYADVVADATVTPQIRALPDGPWVTLTAQSAAAGSGHITIPVPDGATQYAVQILQTQYRVASKTSSSTTVEAWWQKPPAATIGTVTRGADGTILVPFTGSPTARAPWSSILVRWLVDGSTRWQTRTLSGSARAVEIAANPVLGVSVEILPGNAAGTASSAATTKVAPTMVPPSALSAPTVTWDAQGRATVAWVLPTTTPDKRVEAVRVERVATFPDGTQATSTVATVAAPDTSTTDTPPDNVLVAYQLVAINPAGTSETASPPSAQVATVPRGASSLTPRRSGADVVNTWSVPGATTAQSWVLEHTTNPLGEAAPDVDWFPRPAAAGEARSATHPDVSIGTHTYRIRPAHPLLPAELVPPWRYSPTLPADAPPLAPILGDPTPLDAREEIRLPFTHNPVDGSAQTYAHVRFRPYGMSGSWTNRYPGLSDYATIPAGLFVNGQQIEWQAATRGKSGVTGAYASQVFTASPRPEFSFTTPAHGSTVTGSPLVVDWTTSGTTQEVRLTLLDGAGAEIETQVLPVVPTMATFRVQDQDVYTVRGQAWDGVQWSTVAEATVTVNLIRPPRPTLTARVEGESVALSAYAPAGLEARRISMDISRWGDWAVVGSASGSARGLTGPDASTVSTAFASEYGTWQSPLLTVPGMSVGWTITAGMYMSAEPSAPGGTRNHSPSSIDLVGGGQPAVSIVPPTWPEFERVQCADTISTPAWRLQWQHQGGELHWARDPYVILTPDETVEPGEPFDGDSVDPDGVYHYGWLDGRTVAYEAEPVPTGGDIPLASAVRVEMWRSLDNGATWHLLGDAGEGWGLTDDTPPLNRRVLYKARSYAAGGGWADSPIVEVVVDSDHVILDWTDHNGHHTMRGYWDPQLGHDQATAHTESVHYAGDDGTTHWFGPVQPRTVSAAFNVLDEDQVRPADWLRLARLTQTLTYRDPTGIVIEGALTGSIGWSGTSSLVQGVRFTLEEGRAG